MSLPAICVEMGLRLVNGVAIASTPVVAKRYGKRHADVLRDIDEHLSANADLRSRNWFREASYVDRQGKPRRMIEMTRNGFAFLVHKWTGPEPTKFTLRYMDAFDAMEAALSHRPPNELSEFTQAVYALAESNHRRADAHDRRDDAQDERIDDLDTRVGVLEDKTVVKGPTQWFRPNLDKLSKAAREKVRRTREGHAAKYNMTIEELERRGWLIDAMERDCLATFRAGIDRWGRPIAELKDIELDHRDPMGSWDYPSNYDWIHKKSNGDKGTMSAAEYSSYLKSKSVQLDLL